MHSYYGQKNKFTKYQKEKASQTTMITFDFPKFLDLIKENNFEAAFNLKTQSIPKKLYKFFSLSDTPICKLCNNENLCYCDICKQTKPCENGARNDKILATVNKDQLWLSYVDEFNDPFELRALYPDKDMAASHENEIFELLKIIRRIIRVTCFVGKNPIHGLPMWAHYANNHKGFCIEYHVNNSSLLYPISYESNRIPTASLPAKIISTLKRKRLKEIDKIDDISNFYINVLALSSMIKSTHWEYENEYRVFYYSENINERGTEVNLDDLGLEMKQIYIGKSCDSTNRENLINIAKNHDLPITEIFLDEFTHLYQLSQRNINTTKMLT